MEREGSKVRLASRRDLFRLLSFLDGHLPDYSDLHRTILAALLSNNSSYMAFYLTNDDKEDDYLGILAVKQDKGSGNEPKMWFVSTAFSVNENVLLRLYDGLDVINWSRDSFTIYSFDPHSQSGLPDYLRNLGRQIEILPFERFMMDVPSALNLQTNLGSMPDEVYIGSLERCHHAGFVFDRWPFKMHTTPEDVADELDQLPSAGVFLKTTNRLISWATLHPHFGISRVRTLEEFRRQGYGSLAVRYLVKRMAQSGYVPCYDINPNNVASKRLAESMGFRFVATAQTISSLF